MSASHTYIIFQLAGSSYAVRSEDVLHIDMLEHVTPVPNTAPSVEGVVFSRGQVLPALNLRTRFGLPKQETTSSTRLIFIRIGKRTVALIVDSAREFRRIPETAIRPVEETLHGISGNYVKGVASLAERLILILDVAAVLNLEEVQNLATVAASVAPQS